MANASSCHSMDFPLYEQHRLAVLVMVPRVVRVFMVRRSDTCENVGLVHVAAGGPAAVALKAGAEGHYLLRPRAEIREPHRIEVDAAYPVDRCLELQSRIAPLVIRMFRLAELQEVLVMRLALLGRVHGTNDLHPRLLLTVGRDLQVEGQEPVLLFDRMKLLVNGVDVDILALEQS